MSIFKGASSLLCSNLWLLIISLAATPIYVNTLGIEGYALVGIYMMALGILAIIDTSLFSALSHQIAWMSGDKSSEPHVGNVLLTAEIIYFSFIFILAGGVIFSLTDNGRLWGDAFNVSSGRSVTDFRYLAFAVLMQLPIGLYTNALLGLQKHTLVAISAFIFATIKVLGSLFVLEWYEPSLRVLFLWFGFTSILHMVSNRWLCKISLISKRPFELRFDILVKLKTFASSMFLVTALGVVMTQIDKLLLSATVSVREFGYYMLAWTIASGIARLVGPVIQVMGPHLCVMHTQNQSLEAKDSQKIVGEALRVVLAPIVIISVVFSFELLNVWIGNVKVAQEVAPLASVLMIGALAQALSHMPISFMYSQSKVRPVLMLHLTVSISTIVLIWFSIKQYGVTGASHSWALYGLVVYVGAHIIIEPEMKFKQFLNLSINSLGPGIILFMIASEIKETWLANITSAQEILAVFILSISGMLLFLIFSEIRKIRFGRKIEQSSK